MIKKKRFSWFGLRKDTEQEEQSPVSPTPELAQEPNTETLPEEMPAVAATQPESMVKVETVSEGRPQPAEPGVPEAPPPESLTPVPEIIPPTPEEPAKKSGFLARLAKRLSKTKNKLGAGLADLFLGRKIDDALFEELETQLLTADLGVETTQAFIDTLTQKAERSQLQDGAALYRVLKDLMQDSLNKVEAPLVFSKPQDGPYVLLMLGVNGVGKTTTIGKIASQLKRQGKSVMLAAGDTFRAAAVEQLKVWGERNAVPVIAQATGADAASVIFDAYNAAKARGADVLIVDTAGRLQNKAHLMDELKKIIRVLRKCAPHAPHEAMLTLDAGVGQNAISQMKLFNETVPINGLCLTKLDGTAKGGVIFALAEQFHVPIRYIGVGEHIDDLQPFVAKEFIEALFAEDASAAKV